MDLKRLQERVSALNRERDQKREAAIEENRNRAKAERAEIEAQLQAKYKAVRELWETQQAEVAREKARQKEQERQQERRRQERWEQERRREAERWEEEQERRREAEQEEQKSQEPERDRGRFRNDTSCQDAKKRYSREALRLHPDKNRDSPTAEFDFKEMLAEYENTKAYLRC